MGARISCSETRTNICDFAEYKLIYKKPLYSTGRLNSVSPVLYVGGHKFNIDFEQISSNNIISGIIGQTPCSRFLFIQAVVSVEAEAWSVSRL